MVLDKFVCWCISTSEQLSYLGKAFQNLIPTIWQVRNERPVFGFQQVALWHKFLASLTLDSSVFESALPTPLPLPELSPDPCCCCVSRVAGFMLLPALLLSLASQLGTLISQQLDPASTASGLPGPQALQQWGGDRVGVGGSWGCVCLCHVRGG